MRRPTSDRSHAELLADRDAARLLARASELDAMSAGATVTELRAAAAEAGISDRAFDAALAEMQGEAELQPLAANVAPRGRRPARVLVAGAAMLVALAALVLARTETSTTSNGPRPNMPMVEEAFLLRCLTGAEAATLVRPILAGERTTLLLQARAPRVLTIRATPQQLREVRALLERHEAPGAPACAKQ